MDRNIVYPGSIPLDTDLLSVNRNVMVALGALVQATLGTTTVVDGLFVTPTAPASLTIVAGPGSITQLAPVDQIAFGSLSGDTTETLMKMGVNLSPTTFTLTAPTTSGQAVNYLLQASFREADVNAVVLPYYNAANPTAPYLGPNNTGVAQATLRRQSVQLLLKSGAAANVGSQGTPPVDSGWVGLAVVTVFYGQSQITASSIASLPAANLLPYKLPDLRPGFSSLSAFTSSGTFVVPAGVKAVKVTVIGAGAAGGLHATLPSGGGGAGGQAIGVVSGLTAGASVFVTVGAGGVAPVSPADGGAGGTSSFGPFLSATGGSGGVGGSVVSTAAGGSGGAGIGGAANSGGAWGTDAVSLATRGGDGGGPGGGRGTTGPVQGIAAAGFGGGGGGGGSSAASGGVGAPGGNGAAGVVIVEH